MKKRQDHIDGKEDEEDSATFDVTSREGLLNFILVTATMELVIFFLEDCTTLFIWSDFLAFFRRVLLAQWY